jgi:large subunit ribosomal protein L4
MLKMKVIGAEGAVLREEAVPPVFACAPGALAQRVKKHTVFRAVFREGANARAGTASTLRRDEVSGGGRKPWKQKGTGRARQGSTRSPQWRHGGVVFGPKPRSFAVSLNKKERRGAFFTALADRYGNDFVTLLDLSGISITKTAEFAKLLFGDRRGGDDAPSMLVVYAAAEEGAANFTRAGRNLRSVTLVSVDALDISALLGHDRLVLTTTAHEALTARVEGRR